MPLVYFTLILIECYRIYICWSNYLDHAVRFLSNITFVSKKCLRWQLITLFLELGNVVNQTSSWKFTEHYDYTQIDRRIFHYNIQIFV